ncbi:hypothetical protein Q5P01_000563 [Channa striata]|uniref:Uncharacterized protein n=1 Tax=Channa striata TaxID=64152 RepID=A0AA88IHK3_CHASR|nr:hypothetical protein Q5P01_000563 [Channa striata]
MSLGAEQAGCTSVSPVAAGPTRPTPGDERGREESEVRRAARRARSTDHAPKRHVRHGDPGDDELSRQFGMFKWFLANGNGNGERSPRCRSLTADSRRDATDLSTDLSTGVRLAECHFHRGRRHRGRRHPTCPTSTWSPETPCLTKAPRTPLILLAAFEAPDGFVKFDSGGTVNSLCRPHLSKKPETYGSSECPTP